MTRPALLPRRRSPAALSLVGRCGRVLALLCVVASATGAAWADPSGSLEGRVKEHRLANGLTVLALRRTSSPTVSLQMTFLVGGVDEEPGGTGVAHLLEHMLFKGTTRLGTQDWRLEEPLQRAIEEVGGALDAENRKGDKRDAARATALKARLEDLQRQQRPLVVKDEIDGIYARNGAVGFNASTSADLTSYIVSLPSNRLELWARIESERMRDPVLREYYSERDVVVEERRQRYEASPDGKLYGSFLATAFSAHPYRNPVIGWPSDLETLDIRETRDFYRTYYGPDNAVVAAVGDVDPDAFFQLMERYFGPLPAGGRSRRSITAEPPQPGPKRVEVVFDAEPKLFIGYHKPSLPHRHDYVLDVIEALLSDGRSSRLTRELVDRRKVAASVSAANGLPGARYPNLFGVFVTPLAGVDVAEAQAAVEAELRRLTAEPPSREELEKVVRRLEAARVRRLTSNSALARELAYFQAVAGDWRYVEEHPRVLASVTPEEVSEVAGIYFTPTNQTVATLRPTGSGPSK